MNQAIFKVCSRDRCDIFQTALFRFVIDDFAESPTLAGEEGGARA